MASSRHTGGGLSSNPSMSSSTSVRTRFKRDPQPTTIQKCFCILCIIILVVICTWSAGPNFLGYTRASDGTIMAKMEDVVTVPLGPKAITIHGMEHYYLLPHKRPEGVLIFFHSCHRSGSSFFQYPEDRIIAYDALQRGVAVFAPTSKDRESGCWTQKDLPTIQEIVEEWVYSHDLNELPRMGMGDSSGASYLFFVFSTLKLKSMALYNTNQIFLQENMKKKSGKAIPTVFVSMKEDEILTKRMTKNYEQMSSTGIPAKQFQISPHPFSSSLCYSRFPEFENDDCEKLHTAMKTELPGFDRRSVVKQTLTNDEWETFFDKIKDLIDYSSASSYYVRDDAHPRGQPRAWINEGIQQEIKASQGFHSLTSENHSYILDFLIKEARSKQSFLRKSKDDGE
ncbi:unnamed protein product [Cylindrotheca closterium]|uniref:Uncharacterized protein n=1 Tax=Cylindrotheca closterium TaxID=2856 RepID=A0AAD2G9I7_9STRA|nr:unnamed protein product [Cylindrotheca closterium]